MLVSGPRSDRYPPRQYSSEVAGRAGVRIGEPRRRAGGRHWSTRVLVATMVTLLLGAIVGTSALISSNDDTATTTTTAPVTLTGNALELFNLLATKDDATYHARYDGSSPEVSALSLETWQQPPNVRQDSDLTVDGQRAQTSSFVLDATQVRCVRLADAAWTCQPGGSGDTDPLAAIRDRLDEIDVTARDTTISGRTVRCFQFTVDGASNELCLTPDLGIPVLVRASGSELDLTQLDDDVADDVFVPPAAVPGA